MTDQEQLEALNDAVVKSILARRLWLDAKMHELSKLKVGDDIYDLKTGRKVGVVSKLYRYWQDRDEGVRDTSLSWDYEYKDTLGDNCFDNTSRQGGAFLFGTREDALRRVGYTID